MSTALYEIEEIRVRNTRAILRGEYPGRKKKDHKVFAAEINMDSSALSKRLTLSRERRRHSSEEWWAKIAKNLKVTLEQLSDPDLIANAFGMGITRKQIAEKRGEAAAIIPKFCPRWWEPRGELLNAPGQGRQATVHTDAEAAGVVPDLSDLVKESVLNCLIAAIHRNDRADVVLVLGPRGSGKSSLSHILSGIVWQCTEMSAKEVVVVRTGELECPFLLVDDLDFGEDDDFGQVGWADWAGRVARAKRVVARVRGVKTRAIFFMDSNFLADIDAGGVGEAARSALGVAGRARSGGVGVIREIFGTEEPLVIALRGVAEGELPESIPSAVVSNRRLQERLQYPNRGENRPWMLNYVWDNYQTLADKYWRCMDPDRFDRKWEYEHKTKIPRDQKARASRQARELRARLLHSALSRLRRGSAGRAQALAWIQAARAHRKGEGAAHAESPAPGLNALGNPLILCEPGPEVPPAASGSKGEDFIQALGLPADDDDTASMTSRPDNRFVREVLDDLMDDDLWNKVQHELGGGSAGRVSGDDGG